MRGGQRISCVIPAYNEERAIAAVLSGVPAWVDRIVVADNGSVDGTAEVARAGGAHVVPVPERGYGSACLGGLAVLPETDIVVFLDGDYSDHPQEMHTLVDPIIAGRADLVIGSRVLGEVEAGALTPQQRFGNWLATRLVRAIWSVTYTDLGPFRAIRRAALDGLRMSDRTFGWTVEMQIKAAQSGLVSLERPVSYRRRIGQSKISGTIGGSVRAGTRILSLIAREALWGPRAG
ncbi:MAG: glycosyltransferase family 2 protein [Hyphomicrobiaceae bacterium]|nr:glycosyltransferase family 2 protein [Hyphomicrobiaceae bacterium]MCC0008541.1 glycosyltransferase family 2 protein [Hyphomicrobiaceae bacterium]